MDILASTTISSEVQRYKDHSIHFRRSQMDKVLNLASFFIGLGILVIIYYVSSLGINSIFFLLFVGIALALIFRGVLVLSVLKYTIVIQPRKERLGRVYFLFGFFERKIIIPYTDIKGFEIRQYRKRDTSIKEWEFRYILNTPEGSVSHFLGRTKKKKNAIQIAQIMDKDSGLKLISD